MDTVRDLIASSLRLCGAIDSAETPDPEEYNDALGTLNDMLDAFPTEALMLPFTASSAYECVIDQAIFTVGPGGDWDGIRPQDVVLANLRDGNGIDFPLMVVPFAKYADIPVKGTVSRPNTLYYEAQWPLGRVVLFPVPDQEYTIIIGYNAMFTQVTLDTSVLTLPPGYRRCFRYNLAIEIAPEYSRANITEDVRRIAKESKAAIKGTNSSSLDAMIDPRLPGVSRNGRYNINNG